MKRILILLFLISQFSYGQSHLDSLKIKELSEVIVRSTRASDKSGMAYTNVSKADLEKQNLGQDLPFLLNQLPSVVVTSDAGAGVGYTGIRIRGTDPTRINVTLNGIPYNDSESQGVYWVNMPDFASSVQSIQVQRGVGTSTNGAGAFGGSINVNTLGLNKEAFGEINASAGSFNTFKINILTSTGLLNNHWVVDARLSKITSDGFVDRASSNLGSYYISGGYYGQNSFIRFNTFGGHEKTYQSWNGIPIELATNDKIGFDKYAERNFLDDATKADMWNRGRRYNVYSYKNEVDDYKQTHYQLISSLKISEKLRFNPTFHYTKGQGFYEQWKPDSKFANYGLPNIKIGAVEIKKTDLIRQKWLDNDFYGIVGSLEYVTNSKLNFNFGGGWNQYLGGHFGEIIWSSYAAQIPKGYRYYDNTATKNDFNFYAKTFLNLSSKLDIFLDLQIRAVDFKMNGTADALQKLDYSKKYSFFNPKIGLTFSPNTGQNLYLSYAKGSKEPSRQDFVDNAPNLPKAEQLNDFETGYKIHKNNWLADINLYYMSYQNQLVLTGKINQVGEAIRTNVKNSSRLGIELQAGIKLLEKFNLQGNLTVSHNQIKNFNESIPSYDENPEEINQFANTDISFSPSVIAGGQLSYSPIKILDISILPKYVGRQYLDNTSNISRSLAGYFVNDLKIGLKPQIKNLKTLEFSLLINNVFSKKYQSNGYSYSYIYGSKITENFVFPQAGINFLSGVKIKF